MKLAKWVIKSAFNDRNYLEYQQNHDGNIFYEKFFALTIATGAKPIWKTKDGIRYVIGWDTRDMIEIPDDCREYFIENVLKHMDDLLPSPAYVPDTGV
jgi:hypothetical protein